MSVTTDTSQQETSLYRGWHFEEVLSSLTVQMIMSERLETCRADESVRMVQERAAELEDDYDHLPVERDQGFCGFVAVKPRCDDDTRVDASQAFFGLTGESFVASKEPILEFLSSSESHKLPWLVVSGSDDLRSTDHAARSVVGLVTLVDLLKPSVELVLGALLLELEHRMVQRIERDGRQFAASQHERIFHEKAQQDGCELSPIYYTGLRTKLDALCGILDLPEADRQDIRNLRNEIFHVRFRAKYRPEKIRQMVSSIRRAIVSVGPPNPAGVSGESRIRGVR